MAAQSLLPPDSPLWPSRLSRTSLWIMGIGLALAVLAGPLYRFGFAGVRVALLALAAGSVVLGIGVLLGGVALVAAGVRGAPVDRGPVVLGIAIALAVISYLLSWVEQARSTPPIYDVSTDLENPPEFVAVREIRKALEDATPPEYVRRQPGPDGTVLDVPALQRQSYPDVRPLQLPISPDGALVRAKQAADRLGWDIVAFEPSEGRLEATDTTAFFGFKDDVVVRVTASDGGSRVDVRSKSRVGRGDMGANAKRIREFLELMQND